jgi:hypothetical protein
MWVSRATPITGAFILVFRTSGILHPLQRHHSVKKQQDDRRRLQPLDPNIAQRKAPIRRVVVFIRAHGLLRTIDQKKVDQMGPAEDWKFVAVQQPVKPVTGRLLDH